MHALSAGKLNMRIHAVSAAKLASGHATDFSSPVRQEVAPLKVALICGVPFEERLLLCL